MSADPVGDVVDRATAGLPADQAAELRRLVTDGLAQIDPVVGPDDLAVEIAAVARLPAGERLAWARRFAAQRRTFTLRRRSFELLQGFARGADVTAETRTLLREAESALAEDMDDDIRRELGDVVLECRYIISGGTGPASLRTRKAH